MTKAAHEALVGRAAAALMFADAQSVDCQARAVLRAIYEAMREPTPGMFDASMLTANIFRRDWQAVLAASGLAPESETKR